VFELAGLCVPDQTTHPDRRTLAAKLVNLSSAYITFSRRLNRKNMKGTKDMKKSKRL